LVVEAPPRPDEKEDETWKTDCWRRTYFVAPPEEGKLLPVSLVCGRRGVKRVSLRQLAQDECQASAGENKETIGDDEKG
jgi:hypothetical protein